MKGKAMAIIDKMAVCVFAAMITCALAAGECVLLDATNYPLLPQAFKERYGVPVMCAEFGGGGTPERVHRETQAGMLALFAREGIGWMLWTLEDRHGAGQPFPTHAKKVEKSWEIVEQKPPRYWIPFPEIWGPVARIVASPFPARAE